MITSIFIKNFKAYEKNTIPIYEHNIIIGENDCGKTTVLEALDIFFNDEKVNKSYVRDSNQNVEIGIYLNNEEFPNGMYLKKVYTPATYKEAPGERVGNFDAIEGLKFVYLKAGINDPLKIVNDLSVAKTINTTPPEVLEQIKSISQESADSVIASIDNELLVINNANQTNITGEQAFKYDAGIKFVIKSNNVPIESRGLGFQKNLIYALLTGNEYDNVVLGIDEVENSISVNNTSQLLQKVQEKFSQTLITTHSKKVVEVRNEAQIIPIYNNDVNSLAELLLVLDSTSDKKYLLLEGKYDLPWYSQALSLLGVRNDYIILPSGGDGNVENLKVALTEDGKECFVITDGDVGTESSLNKDCIELYIPLESLNEIFGLELEEVPSNKNDFFESLTVEGVMNEDTVKDKLSQKASGFLTIDNELIQEIRELLNL